MRSIRIRLFSLGTILVALLSSCNSFYPAWVDGGIPSVSIRDTVALPADSIVIPPLHPINDTIVQQYFKVRAGCEVRIRFDIESPADADSVEVYGLLRGLDSLQAAYQRNGAQNYTPLGGEFEIGPGYLNLPLHFAIHGSDGFTISINHPGDTAWQVNALLLAGYQSPEPSIPNIVKNLNMSEIFTVSLHTGLPINAGNHFWKTVNLEEGDSLVGSVAGKATIDAYLMDNASLDDFLATGTEPGQSAYHRQNDGDSIRYQAQSTESLVFLIMNRSSTQVVMTDTLLRVLRFTEQ
jgi:hypothetical protein